jgi:PAS domain-containing protein
LLTEDSSEAGFNHFKTLLEQGISKGELQFKHKNGLKRWWSVDAVKLTEKRFIGFTKDVTDIRQTEENLQIHQIELKMQNDEFCIKQEDLEAAMIRYADLYNMAPAGYLTISEKGLILKANLHASDMLDAGRGDLLNHPLTEFIYKDDQDICYLHFKKLSKKHPACSGKSGKTSGLQSCKLRIITRDGTVFPAYLQTAAFMDANGDIVYLVVIMNLSGNL